MQRKKRILMCNEAHYLLTGFGTYGKEVLERLAATGKYELAEFASYARIGDKRDSSGWMFYPNEPAPNDPRMPQYNSDPQNQWGKWRFDRVLLDFRPDIVWDIRDYWMFSYQENSPFRDFYHWSIMPTVDSAPQRFQWIDTYCNADSVLTYSDWAIDVLKKEGNGHINVVGSAPPAVSLDVLKPVADKIQHRANFGFSEDAIVFGTIMRNQLRKLYPDLFQAFRKYLDKCLASGRQDLHDRSYLYCHVSYPDNAGWDIPLLLKQNQIGHKVIFTYVCDRCKMPFCTLFQDGRTVCPKCNAPTAFLPSVSRGLDRDQMATIINFFDFYIQYSVCEGFGMPQVEAAACGVPIMSVDYSAMEDIVRKTKGFPIPVERMFHDLGTGSERALPDNEKFSEMLFKVSNMSLDAVKSKRKQAREAVEKYYNWDRTAKIWEDHFDSIELTGLQGKWDAPIRRLPTPNQRMPMQNEMNNAAFIDWCMNDILQKPERAFSRHAQSLLRELNFGVHFKSGEKGGTERITREDVFNTVNGYATEEIYAEKCRTGQVIMKEEDFIQYAHQKASFMK